MNLNVPKEGTFSQNSFSRYSTFSLLFRSIVLSFRIFVNFCIDLDKGLVTDPKMIPPRNCRLFSKHVPTLLSDRFLKSFSSNIKSQSIVILDE